MLAQELLPANLTCVSQTHMVNFRVHYKIGSVTKPLFTMSAFLTIVFLNTVNHQGYGSIKALIAVLTFITSGLLMFDFVTVKGRLSICTVVTVITLKHPTLLVVRCN